MEMTNTEKLCISLSVSSLIASVYIIRKILKIAKDLDIAVDDISKDIKVEVPKKIIQEATDRAVEEETEKQAEKAAKEIIKNMNASIKNEVLEAVNEEKKELKDKVKLEITKAIGEVDISDIKDEVVDKAALKASEKFDHDLNAIIEQHNAKLDNISTIYEAIARNFGNNGKIILP